VLLKRLTEYADRLSLPPPMYDRTQVRWIIDLDRDGNLLGFVPLEGTGRKGDRGKEMVVPYVMRSSAIKPKLLADNGEYVLAIPRDPEKEKRVEESHKQFLSLVRTCAEETGEPAVKAVLVFLESWKPESGRTDLPEDFDPGMVLAFRAEGAFPADLPAVKAFWASYTEKDHQGYEGQCDETDRRASIHKNQKNSWWPDIWHGYDFRKQPGI
jgi:CRISPR-associated protein Csd1